MITHRIPWLLLAILLLGTGCSRSEGPEYRAMAGGEIRIGVLLSSGTGTHEGSAYAGAIGLARDDFNQYLSDAGIPARLVCDMTVTGGDTAGAIRAMESFYAAGIRIVVSTGGVAELKSLRYHAKLSGMLVISPCATEGSLALPDDNLFRFILPDATEGDAISLLLAEDKIRVIVPLVYDDIRAHDLFAATSASFVGEGGSVHIPVVYSPFSTGFGEVLAQLDANVGTELLHHNPNEVAVYLIAGPEGAGILASAKSYPSLNNVYWYGGSGFSGNPEVLHDTLAALFTYTHGLPCPVPATDEEALPVLEPVRDRLVTLTGREPSVTAYTAYDAVWLAALTLRTASDQRIETLQKVLISESARYSGITGNTRLNDNGDRASGWYDFLAVKCDSGGYTWKRVARYNTRDGSLQRYNR